MKTLKVDGHVSNVSPQKKFMTTVPVLANRDEGIEQNGVNLT